MNLVWSSVQDLAKGTPWVVILIGVLVALWQYTQHRSNIEMNKARAELERAKFEYKKNIEELKFINCQQQWREQLAIQLTLKHVEARLTEYSSLWSQVGMVDKHRTAADELTPTLARGLAHEVKRWRYSTGGLLAEQVTRDAAYAFQKVLWDYDGESEGYKRIRKARRILRDALRADMGVSADMSGKFIADVAAERSRIQIDLTGFQSRIGISPDPDR